jgi:glycosyltransferase involved in cell wall biosynthesis
MVTPENPYHTDHETAAPSIPRVLFVYWGRRGALPRFALELADAAAADPTIRATVSVSRQNMNFEEFKRFGSLLLPVETFASNAGAILKAWHLPFLVREVKRHIQANRIEFIIDLMPHVWSPFLAWTAKTTGATYVPIIHEAEAHPGDHTAWTKNWIDRSIGLADLVITLSGAVAGRLEATGRVHPDRIKTLYHPDLAYLAPLSFQQPQVGKPLRLLFLGRIMTYKGLPLFIDAVELLHKRGHAVEVGVFGEGALGACRTRLASLGAEVVNRWLSEEEIRTALSKYQVVVLSHIEASQSGVAATSLGAGIPVVTTPVGGLIEQIQEGRTGLIALRADGPALADAIEDLLLNPILYTRICENIERTRDERSMRRFVKECVAAAKAARYNTNGNHTRK